MARLKSSRRRKLPKSSFAIPSRRAYPIDTPARARAALAYAARPTTRGSYSTVRKAVASTLRQESPDPQGEPQTQGTDDDRSAARGRSRRASA